MKGMQHKGNGISSLSLVLFLSVAIAAEQVDMNQKDNDSIPMAHKHNLQFKSSHACDTDQNFAWCLPADYDNEVEPWKYRRLINLELPWYYYFEYDINDIQEVNDKEQTITLDMYWSINWFEPRLKIDLNTSHWRNESMAMNAIITPLETIVAINLPLNDLKRFWIPDSEIYGAKSFTSEEVLTPAASFRLSSDKLLRYNARSHAVVSCQMNFKDYPFDTQNCIFRQGSFYNPREIVDCKSKTTHRFEQQRNLQYSIEILELPPKYQTVLFHRIGNWSTCGFQIVLKRQKTQILFQVYFTATLLVFASFVSFIVNPDVVPGRMGLLVTIFLVLINIFISVQSNSPPSSGFLTALDVFLVVCIVEVFTAFSEYALVLLLCLNQTKIQRTKSPNPKRDSVDRSKRIPRNSNTGDKVVTNGWMDNMLNFKPDNHPNKLDQISLLLFPASFVIFNVVYYFIYLYSF